MGRLTEKEAIEGFKIDNALLGENEPRTVERNNIAIKCIEELQEYRSIIDSPEKLKLIDALYLERCEEINRLNKELAEYKKLEDEGLLLRLPCKEVLERSGDIIYYILEDEVIEVTHCGISIDYNGKIWIALVCDENIFPYRAPDAEHDLDPTDWCTNSMQTTLEEWNKTILFNILTHTG